MNRHLFHFKLRVIGAIVLFGATLHFGVARAQSTADLKINEVLVFNDSNYVDDFGVHSAWIEIFNSAYNTVNIGGLYLTNDTNNPTMYRIPKGQPVTAIAPRSFLVFWADGLDSRGILHLNFELKDSKLIALYDSDGKTLIDSLVLPFHAQHDVTYGYLSDGDGVKTYLEKSTPNGSNQTKTPITGAETFAKFDPLGMAMTAIAMGVVFFSLALLFLFFKFMSWLFIKDKGSKRTVTEVVTPKDELSGEVNAAIALTLYLYRNQMHDHENTVLTINKVARAYSPWSSKIYGLRRWPRS